MKTKNVTSSQKHSSLNRATSKKQIPISNVTADEIVAVGSTIELTLGAQVDPQSAQGAIRVVRGCEQVATGIALAKPGRVVTVRLRTPLARAVRT